MDLDISKSSADTDVLVKLPPDFFDPNFNEKSHFSNEKSFMNEIDNFLKTNQQKDVLNSTATDLPSYHNFADTLQSSPNDQDLNLQLITIFQKKIQIQANKIAYLAKSNAEKDEIIRKLKGNEGLDVENVNLKKKIHQLEQEVANTMSFIKRYETKNEMLELKIENLTSTSKEMSDLSKKQIHELETRLSNSGKIEKELRKEIEDINERFKEERSSFMHEKQDKNKLERENSKLKEQLKQAKEEKVQILEKFDHDRQALEIKQKKIFSSMMDDFSEKERKIVKELDAQRIAFKNYYQAQLETALEEKVKEYQEQLNKYQSDIQSEIEEREKTFQERSMSQMELFIQKNEEEIDLIRRKCKEEVDLYRIQLFNAHKNIESLEFKLSEYQMRRINIADNLHTIMESQWKKILDVLSCPSRPPSQLRDDNSSHGEISESDNNKQNQFEKLNNLSRSEENLKAELLRNYIDKLLKRPPKSSNNHYNGESSKTIHPSRSTSSSTKAHNRPWK